jgi:hypothetical protein
MYNNLQILSSTTFSPATCWRGRFSPNCRNLSLSCKSCQNASLHLSRELYKSHLFLQNEPNFKITLNDISTSIKGTYDNFLALFSRKNEPKRTQNEPNFSPKLASFFSKLALIQNKIVAFWYSLRCKFGRVERDEQARLQRTLRREQKVVEDDPAKSLIYDNLRNLRLNKIVLIGVNPVILSKKNQFKIIVYQLKMWYNSLWTWYRPVRSEILTQKERKIKALL